MAERVAGCQKAQRISNGAGSSERCAGSCLSASDHEARGVVTR